MHPSSAAPIISCVLPTYNGAKYLQKALDAISSQDFESFEVLIVDDCSTDETPTIAQAHCHRDSRFRVIRNSRNLKLPASLNAGFREARGKYWTWTSDDNFHQPNAFRILSETLERRSEVGLVYTDQILVDEFGQVTQHARAIAPGMLVFGNTVGASFLYRKAVAEQAGEYDENLFLAEDFDYWLRISQTSLIARLHEPIYNYRFHSGSLTAKRQKDIAIAHERGVLKNIENLNWLKPSGKAYAYRDLAFRALSQNRSYDFFVCLLNAVFLKPSIFLTRNRLQDLFVTNICAEFDDKDKSDLDWTLYGKWKLFNFIYKK